jgi:ElaA protein
MPNNITWTCKAFQELSPIELYRILQLRNEVFVVEQHCIFQDADNNDFTPMHFMAWCGEELAAYTRLFNKGITYPEASIGRVITSPKFRRIGLGKQLMINSIDQIFKLYGEQPIQIGAQLYLKKFYESFGFQAIGEVYDEDGIPHVHMIRPL